jgi:hypothetical protein
MKVVSVILALAIGNFFYQAMTGHQWRTAAERSWFQGWAIVIYWMMWR